MKRPVRMLLKAAKAIDVPPQLIREVPRVTMEANTRVFVENHGGISSYSEQRICIYTALELLQIEGSGLRIERMDRQNIWICGVIEQVGYRGRD